MGHSYLQKTHCAPQLSIGATVCVNYCDYEIVSELNDVCPSSPDSDTMVENHIYIGRYYEDGHWHYRTIEWSEELGIFYT